MCLLYVIFTHMNHIEQYKLVDTRWCLIYYVHWMKTRMKVCWILVAREFCKLCT